MQDTLLFLHIIISMASLGLAIAGLIKPKLAGNSLLLGIIVTMFSGLGLVLTTSNFNLASCIRLTGFMLLLVALRQAAGSLRALKN